MKADLKKEGDLGLVAMVCWTRNVTHRLHADWSFIA